MGFDVEIYRLLEEKFCPHLKKTLFAVTTADPGGSAV
jgi:hypothetical protein